MGKKYLVIWLSIIIILVFFLQFIPGFNDLFTLNNGFVMPWQFFTAIFLHGGVSHLFYNLFSLLFFGLIAENLLGSKKFIWLFIISGVIANIISFNFYPSSLGASGAIFALIGVVAVLRPMMTVWVFGIIVPMFLAAIIWVGISIFGIFGLGDSGIGYIAHLSGIMIGVVYGFYLRLKYPHPSSQNKKIELDEGYIKSWEDNHLKR